MSLDTWPSEKVHPSVSVDSLCLAQAAKTTKGRSLVTASHVEANGLHLTLGSLELDE